MSYTTIIVNTPMTSADVLDQLNPQVGAPSTSLDRVSRIMNAWATKAFDYTTVTENVGAVRATGTVTFSSTGPVADETMTVAGVTITAKTSATPGALEFTRSNTPSVDATNLAALLNTHASFTGVVTAAAALGVVTVTAAVPGTIGNAIGLTESMTNTGVSGALLTGGTNGTSTVIPA